MYFIWIFLGGLDHLDLKTISQLSSRQNDLWLKYIFFLYHGLIYIDRFSQVVTCYCEMFIHFIVCTALWFCRQALVKLHLVLWPGTLPCSHCSRSLYRSFLSSPLILQPGLYCKIEERKKKKKPQRWQTLEPGAERGGYVGCLSTCFMVDDGVGLYIDGWQRLLSQHFSLFICLYVHYRGVKIYSVVVSWETLAVIPEKITGMFVRLHLELGLGAV